MGILREWLIELLTSKVDDKACPYCYFGGVSPFLHPADRQSLFQCTTDCKCQRKKFSESRSSADQVLSKEPNVKKQWFSLQYAQSPIYTVHFWLKLVWQDMPALHCDWWWKNFWKLRQRKEIKGWNICGDNRERVVANMSHEGRWNAWTTIFVWWFGGGGGW